MSEKEKLNPRTINMSTRLNIPLALGTMEYIAGIDPKETWLPVSKDDMDMDEFDKVREKHMEQIRIQEQSKEYQEKLQGFTQECIALYQGIVEGNSDAVKPYTQGRTFNFILGMPRTGGTTLYQALSEAYGWPWEKLLLSMTHNFMPNGRYCLENPASEFDMGWRLPHNFQCLVFELCQFLVYINNEAQDSEHIFLKSTALSYAVKFLNYMFGQNANYFITVRHPGAVTLTSGDEEITREHHMQNMATWTNLYSSIIRDCRPAGRLRPVLYGSGMTDVINAAFEQMKIGERLEETHFFEYENFDKEFYESDGTKQMFDYVKASWKLFDLDFPEIDTCI